MNSVLHPLKKRSTQTLDGTPLPRPLVNEQPHVQQRNNVVSSESNQPGRKRQNIRPAGFEIRLVRLDNRVGTDSVLAQIQATLFFFGINSDTQGEFQSQPNDQAEHDRECTDCSNTC